MKINIAKVLLKAGKKKGLVQTLKKETKEN